MGCLSTTLRDSLFASKGCVPVGIDESIASNELSIHPNPSSGIFNFKLQLKKSEAVSVQIFDLTGHLILQKSYLPQSNFNEFIDLTEYANGCYFAKIDVNTATFNIDALLEIIVPYLEDIDRLELAQPV